jgi:hypothetical protein
MKKLIILGMSFFAITLTYALPNKIVIIRHGEKPGGSAQNLSCSGLNRSIALIKVLPKFGIFKQVYVPALTAANNYTAHSRMFQTASPFAIANNIAINSQFKSAKNQIDAAGAMKKESGDVLVVWNHTYIPELASALGVADAPKKWAGDDFDSVWIITYSKKNQARLQITHESIHPKSTCSF